MICAVLFDLDGVLVDACEWHYLALNQALLEVVGYEISRQEHVEKHNGLPTKVKLKNLSIEGNEFDKVWELKQKYTIDTIQLHGKIDSDKVDLLSYLKHYDIKIACVTNSIRETAILMLDVTGQTPYIDLLISNEDIGNPKPHPDPYNSAIELLRVNPKLSLAVEDSRTGIRSAAESNVGMIWKVENSKHVTKKNFIAAFGGFLV